jgi:4a-hydroxytetrahydrobiopterin dehydratase
LSGVPLFLGGDSRPADNGNRSFFEAGGTFMPAKKLNDMEVQDRLKKAKGWSLVNGKLHREFQCKDFVAAFGNMTRVALVAESMNHHPEWFNVWNKVVIDLNTHSVKGISDYDFTLAEKINEIFGA